MLLCFLLFFAANCLAEEPPKPALQKSPPPGLEGLVWNKWDTPNFVVISLDAGQGSSMRREVESVRSDVAARWSLSFGSDRVCKIVCVPDSVMLKRLFGLSEPRCEVRRLASGGVEAAVWLDIERKDLLPSLVAEAELLSGGGRSFVVKGVPLLERPASFVRERLSAVPEVALDSLLGTSSEKADADALAANSAVLCLLVRKEFGATRFGECAASSSASVADSLGFSSEDEFGSTFARYRRNLSSDLKSGRTPDGYLGVRP